MVNWGIKGRGFQTAIVTMDAPVSSMRYLHMVTARL